MTTITKEQKETYSEKYFGGMKPKELKETDFTTPAGHTCKALISRKPNRYLGSLLILEVDGEPVEQFIQGMPKIHYLDNYHMITTDDYMDVYEKLDGTNICLYGLRDHTGKHIETVPKSRNMPVLDEQFRKLYEQADTKAYEDYINEHKDSILYFELYGMGNLHSIKHINTYLDLRVLGAYDGKRFMPDKDVSLSFNKRPNRLFRLYKTTNGYYVNSSGLNSVYRGYTSAKGFTGVNVEECIGYMKDTLEDLNKEYEKHNGRFAIEGVVINGQDTEGNFLYIKVKPDTIEMAHKSENGIPRQYIMKEVMKYLDEHRSTALETWESNPDDVMEYLNRNLAESFEQPFIDKSQDKIRRLFDEKVNPMPTPEEIMEIGDSLMREYPEKSITDLMRIFGQTYPDKKKSGGKLYKYLEAKKV